ncbi:Hypothetical protein CINCED_3A022918 [Cinara cedri]|uniref:Uncharacterized protein n=1 Tax=Cinara cedri TaxID=506608 RepID=A0A5E4M021_9HEMI|nr:Hypothetical protein CINCED_3A022918 [Cinara cedri]
MIAATFVFILTVTTMTSGYVTKNPAYFKNDETTAANAQQDDSSWFDDKTNAMEIRTKLCTQQPDSIWCRPSLEHSEEIDGHRATESPADTKTATGSSAIPMEIMDGDSSDASSRKIQRNAPKSLYKGVITSPPIVPKPSIGAILPKQTTESTLNVTKPIMDNRFDNLTAENIDLLRSSIRHSINKSLKKTLNSFITSIRATNTAGKFTDKKNPTIENSPNVENNEVNEDKEEIALWMILIFLQKSLEALSS